MNLREVIGLVTPQLNLAAQRMWATVDYHEWLATSYDLVRATAPLLSEALAECVRRGDGELVAYFGEQLTDEHGHDRWLEQDWAATGADPAALTARVPSPSAARLAGAQYYWIRHADPVALTGHIAVLEWHPPAAGLVAALMARTGLPRNAFRTLERHARLDAAHGPRLVKLLETMPLNESRRRLVTTSALTTAHGLVELMIELGERHDRSIPPGAAGLQRTVRDRGADRGR